MKLATGVVNDHISYLDNGLLGAAGFGSTYLVRGTELAIVETGTSLCAPDVLAGLAQLGVRPTDIRHIVLTHVHMDHAGGAGTLARQMPDANVYLHSLTIPHLIDPSKLLASAARALGALFPAHGTLEPLASDRLYPAEELRLDLGHDVVLQAIYTPGHSPDHLSYLDLASGAFFTGDAVGVDLPVYRYLGPVTPPPAIDVDLQQRTFEQLLELPIKQLLFSHFGPAQADPHSVIEQLRDRYTQFTQLVRAGVEVGHVDEAAILRTMLKTDDLPDDAAWVLAGWINMSIRGMTRYWSKQ
ncbi:MAG: MBL fold metallo-hydrolase [Herpetosiphonaceae bacterium]|nr:MBL fold metallo-hydrolase [Herpetosiphonaceae bacterium]